MSFLRRLFGSGEPEPTPDDVEEQLHALEEEAKHARPGYVGSSYNRAGDLALRDGQEARALGYYGRAIDAFLEDAQREAARGVANKILRVRPGTIRTLATLTWLDLAARHPAMALLHLRDYAEAAADAGEQARAATQIHRMARHSADAEFLAAAADALDALDFGNRAREVRGWTSSGGPDRIDDEDRMATVCLEAAIRSNDPRAALIDDEVGDDDPVGSDAEDGSEDRS